jgi:hypothetical protein
MKSSLFVLVGLAAALFLPNIAQSDDTLWVADTTWNISVEAGLALAQTAYSDNWAGGEIGQLSWTYSSVAVARKQLSSKMHSKTTLKLSFGQNYSQTRNDDGSTHWERPKKITDMIDLESVLRFTLQGFVDPYAAARWETQFYDGSYRPLKRFLSPSKFTESAGGIKTLVNVPGRTELTTRLGLALREIATKVILDTVAEKTDWVTTTDGGFESVTDLKMQLRSNLSYTSKLSLYKALFYSEKDNVANDYWKAIDANWEHILSASITKYLQTSLYFQLLYDKEIDKGVRVKETLGMGLAYKIG